MCAPKLRPFAKSIKDFYTSAFTLIEYDCPVKVLRGLQVRAELFKLFYEKNEFVLYNKADAFEALDQILTVLHGALSTQGRSEDLDMF